MAKGKIFTAVAIVALLVTMGVAETKAQTLPILATVNVVKQVVGSTLPPSSFTLQISGAAFSTTTFQGSVLGTPLFLNATGTYTIRELNTPANFAVSYSPGCTGVALLNTTSTCIVTNTFTGTTTPPPPPPPPPAGLPETGAGNPFIPAAIALVLLSGTGLILSRRLKIV